MSAELLRKAAETLQERANWHGGEVVPWRVSDDEDGDIAETIPGRDPEGQCYIGTTYSREDALCIATMHPGVGLALADVLDEVAGWREEGLGLMPSTNLADAWNCVERRVAALAHLIVGEQP